MVSKLLNKALESSLVQRIVQGAGWNLIATFLARGVPLIAMIEVARIIEKSAFGELGAVTGTIAMFGALAAAGMGITAAKHIAEYRDTNKLCAGRIIGMSMVTSLSVGIILATFLYVMADWLALHVLGEPHLTESLRLGAFILIFTALQAAQTGVLIGFEAFKLMSFANVLLGVLTFSFVVYGAVVGHVQGALYGFLGAGIAGAIINSFAISKVMRAESIGLHLRMTNNEWHILRHFSLPSLAGAIMFAPVHWFSMMLLINQPDGFSEMAVFTAANQWFALLLFLPGVITNTLMPIFSGLVSSGDFVKLRESLKTGAGMIAMIIIPMSIVVILASPLIMKLYGPGYSDGWPVFDAIVLAAVSAGVVNMLTNLLAAFNRMWVRLISDIAWALVYICGTYYLLQLGYGALGLALAMLMAFIVKTIIVLVILMHHMKTNMPKEIEEVSSGDIK